MWEIAIGKFHMFFWDFFQLKKQKDFGWEVGIAVVVVVMVALAVTVTVVNHNKISKLKSFRDLQDIWYLQNSPQWSIATELSLLKTLVVARFWWPTSLPVGTSLQKISPNVASPHARMPVASEDLVQDPVTWKWNPPGKELASWLWGSLHFGYVVSFFGGYFCHL